MISITDKAIIELITLVEQQSEQIFWLRTPDFMQQLYVTDTFDQIWGRSLEPLFEHPTAFRDSLVPEDENIRKAYNKRKQSSSVSEKEQTILSRIITPTGEIKHMRDSCFSLHDSYGNTVGMAGIGKVITPSEWGHDLDGKVKETHPLSKILQSLAERHTNAVASPMCKEVKLSYKMYKGKYLINTYIGEIVLTPREFETLQLLLAGNTAKETAKVLNISPRTVQDYLINLRVKLECRNKLEIANRVLLQTKTE